MSNSDWIGPLLPWRQTRLTCLSTNLHFFMYSQLLLKYRLCSFIHCLYRYKFDFSVLLTWSSTFWCLDIWVPNLSSSSTQKVNMVDFYIYEYRKSLIYIKKRRFTVFDIASNKSCLMCDQGFGAKDVHIQRFLPTLLISYSQLLVEPRPRLSISVSCRRGGRSCLAQYI